MVKFEHEIGKEYDAPRPCSECGHKRAVFQTSATDYGAWWKCTKCGNVFGTYENPPYMGDTGDIWFSEEDQKKHEDWMKKQKFAVKKS